MSTDRYTSPLSERYASKEMQYIFSQDMKFQTWRRLWIALAETEKELGLDITQEQIDELKANADNINYDVAKEYEKKFRHDVMSHVHHASMGFAMSIADLCWVRDYFKNDEGRNPSLTELKVIDTYWSDHCRHTTFATELDEIKIDSGKYTEAINKALEQYFDIRKEVYGDRDRIVCLMDMACIGDFSTI